MVVQLLFPVIQSVNLNEETSRLGNNSFHPSRTEVPRAGVEEEYGGHLPLLLLEERDSLLQNSLSKVGLPGSNGFLTCEGCALRCSKIILVR
jgi:hypothetical protein